MASEALIIRNGRVIDPGRDLDQVASVLVEDGRISMIGEMAAAGENLDSFAKGMYTLCFAEEIG